MRPKARQSRRLDQQPKRGPCSYETEESATGLPGQAATRLLHMRSGPLGGSNPPMRQSLCPLWKKPSRKRRQRIDGAEVAMSATSVGQVVSVSSRRVLQRAECPLEAGIGGPPVTSRPRGHHPALAGCSSDGRSAGGVPSRFGALISRPVVAELAQDPCAENMRPPSYPV
jgi:hypothetical protein